MISITFLQVFTLKKIFFIKLYLEQSVYLFKSLFTRVKIQTFKR